MGSSSYFGNHCFIDSGTDTPEERAMRKARDKASNEYWSRPEQNKHPDAEDAEFTEV